MLRLSLTGRVSNECDIFERKKYPGGVGHVKIYADNFVTLHL